MHTQGDEVGAARWERRVRNCELEAHLITCETREAERRSAPPTTPWFCLGSRESRTIHASGGPPPGLDPRIPGVVTANEQDRKTLAIHDDRDAQVLGDVACRNLSVYGNQPSRQRRAW